MVIRMRNARGDSHANKDTDNGKAKTSGNTTDDSGELPVSWLRQAGFYIYNLKEMMATAQDLMQIVQEKPSVLNEDSFELLSH
ncbi:hypothetical protein PanWU01x14_231630 [Parasponia andersonii]|uniref:Uncharacterized protein n=1 Tax=Parasponia andersonii TaxID=3476 RepID=A0A2P5BK54_PARAD|nr:hypothetical protein PanWU01x14_231630 [Parasponia andersonii]